MKQDSGMGRGSMGWNGQRLPFKSYHASLAIFIRRYAGLLKKWVIGRKGLSSSIQFLTFSLK